MRASGLGNVRPAAAIICGTAKLSPNGFEEIIKRPCICLYASKHTALKHPWSVPFRSETLD